MSQLQVLSGGFAVGGQPLSLHPTFTVSNNVNPLRSREHSRHDPAQIPELRNPNVEFRNPESGTRISKLENRDPRPGEPKAGLLEESLWVNNLFVSIPHSPYLTVSNRHDPVHTPVTIRRKSPNPETRNPEPETRNPKPESRKQVCA